MIRRIVLLAVVLSFAGATGASDIVSGAQLYRKHCAACHGAQGTAVWPNTPSFARRENLLQPDLALVERIRAGRNAMPAYRGVLSEREMLSVVAYLRTLAR